MSARNQPTPEGPAWNVTGQQQASDQGPNGLLVPGVRIHASLGDGTPFSVWVPHAQYNLQMVNQLLQDMANRTAAIGNLRGIAHIQPMP